MTFHVYVSDGMDRLVDGLVPVLEKEPLSDPLMPEVIALQGLGMRAWLARELAERRKIWANFQFPFPRDLIRVLLEQVLGPRAQEEPVFSKDILTWAIIAELPGLLERDAFSPLAAYISVGADERERQLRLYQLCARIADCFDQYAIARPDLVLNWEGGADPFCFLPKEQCWQPTLWQEISRRLKKGAVQAHPAAMEQAFRARLEKEGKTMDLPERVVLFGVTALPPMYLRMLSALSNHTQVHLFTSCPSQELLQMVDDRAEQLRAEPELCSCREDFHKTIIQKADKPLLTSLAQQTMEFMGLLQCQAGVTQIESFFGSPGRAKADTFLGAVQRGLLNPQENRADCPLRDGSFSVHSCHSPMREVEVIQDQLRGLFARHSDLTPGDVIVMAPDMEVYAPLIEAVFDEPLDSDRRIPTAVSDRAYRREMPVVDGLLSLMGMAQARFTLGEVFGFLERDPVRKKMEFTQAEVDTLLAWLEKSGVRWGADEKHRSQFDQPAYVENTWRFGLERLLLGTALPSQNHDDQALYFKDRLPAELAEGLGAEPLGRLGQFTEKLFHTLNKLSRARTLPAWRDLLNDTLDKFFSSDSALAYQHQALRTQLDELAGQAEAIAFNEPVAIDAVRAHLEGALDNLTSGRGFLSGAVTFCKLLPMRSVPYRVICLMGMNDQSFPRTVRPAGFDLMADQPRPGDRSVRLDDRYQFLESVLAARDALVITYEGQGIQSNETKPPATVLAELLDLAARLSPEQSEGDSIDKRRERLVTVQPLQPFSPRLFHHDPDTEQALISYEERQLATAQAQLAPRQEAAPFQLNPLPEPADEERNIDLEDLLRFFRRPVEYTLKRRLGIYLPQDVELLPDREPLDPGPLDRHGVGEQLIAAGEPSEEIFKHLRAQGALPTGQLGRAFFDSIWSQVDQVLRQTNDLSDTKQVDPVILDLKLDRLRISGSLTGVTRAGLLSITYGKLHAERLLGMWIRHLALCAQAPTGIARASEIFGRKDDNTKRSQASLNTDPDSAREHLNSLADLFWLGQSNTLRFFPKTSWAYAWDPPPSKRSKVPPATPMARAQNQYEGGDYSMGDDGNAYVQQAFGDIDPLNDLPKNDPMSFQVLAKSVFEPLIAALSGGKS